ncbi:hypothetical protein E4U42_001908, partial [Claviceps africana]
MRGSPIIYDGLWRCLCPGFAKLARRRAVVVDSPWPTTRLAAARHGYVALRGRRLMTSESWAEPAAISGDSTTTMTTTTHDTTMATTTHDTTAALAHNLSSSLDGVPPHKPLLAPTPPTKEMLRQSSLDDIVNALLTMRQPEGWDSHGKDIDRHGRILLLVRHLIIDRRQQPNLFMYESIMDAMADPQGSVKGIRKLFEDMASRNLKPTSDLCQSALAALTNHPDYVLRQDVVDTMKEYWFPVDTVAKQNLVLGLLRDEQYELAYLRLTEMMDQKVCIDLWVYDVFVVVLGKLCFLDEMLLLLYRRKSLVREDKDMTSLLYYALDVCSQAFHHAGTVFAWNSLVRTSLLPPSDGVVENVLATAARHGDTALATEALDKISQRTRLLAHHFESAVEAFSVQGDMDGAFRTLAVMKKNGIPVVRATTRAVHEALARYPKLIRDAQQSLRDL